MLLSFVAVIAVSASVEGALDDFQCLHCKNPCHYIWNIIDERHHREQLRYLGAYRSDVIAWREIKDD